MSYRFKVALVGDERVGKTASIRRFIDGSFSGSYKQTLGVEVTVKVIQIGHDTVIFSIFDIAAQPTYKIFRANYYAGAGGFFLLFDQTDHGTFDHLDEWVHEIRAAAPASPILLIGNKNDLPQKQVNPEEITNATGRLGCSMFFKTSAKTGEGIEDMFLWMGKNLLKPRP